MMVGDVQGLVMLEAKQAEALTSLNRLSPVTVPPFGSSIGSDLPEKRKERGERIIVWLMFYEYRIIPCLPLLRANPYS